MARQIEKRESFSYFAPTAGAVQLVGDFTGWELEPGTHEYRFKVDGQWRDDEECAQRRPNEFGAQNCVREVK